MSLATLALVAGVRTTEAQLNVTCHPPASSHEAKLLAFFATPIAFSPGGMAAPLPAGRFRIHVEAAYVPSPSREIQQPEACYGVKKTENTDLTPVFPRPRLALGVPGGFVLEGSYLPPVEVADAKPNLGSVAISRPFSIREREHGRPVVALLRAHATLGRVRGSITCPEKAIQQDDPSAACYGTERSLDTYKPNMFGVEGALMTTGADDAWGAYGLAGTTWLRPRFQVGFQYLGAAFDDTKISVDMTRFAAGAGFWRRVGSGAAITGEVYSVPADATTFRVGGAYTFR